MENGGYLSASNITDIFNNVSYTNEPYKKAFIDSALEGNEKILVE
jgi:hypothetical protein